MSDTRLPLLQARPAAGAFAASPDTIAALYALAAATQCAPSTFCLLFESGIDPSAVLDDPQLLPEEGQRGDALREAIRSLTSDVLSHCHQAAIHQLRWAEELSARILTYASLEYPPALFGTDYAVPVLYARGNAELLAGGRRVACIGSRRIRNPYRGLHDQFCAIAVRNDAAIVSGFALGADTVGHRRALEDGGRTICVMPKGLDGPFPPENEPLWNELLSYPGALFFSEYPFGAPSSARTLRRRNRLITGLAHALLVSQSAATGGAMHAFRVAVHQKKPVATFAADGATDTAGNTLIAAHRSDPEVFGLGADSRAEFGRWLGGLFHSA